MERDRREKIAWRWFTGALIVAGIGYTISAIAQIAMILN